MSSIKFIGRTTDFKGKSVWQIVSNLKDFGIGRVIVRSRMERYPENSYMRIVKVEALSEPVYKKNRKYEPPVPFVDEDRKCRVWVEKVFRGKKFEKTCCIESASYKRDYRLLSKIEEEDYCKNTDVPIKLIHPRMSLPALLREFIIKETGESDPTMLVKCNKSILTNSRLANEGEQADIHIAMGLGKPSEISQYLYKNTISSEK